MTILEQIQADPEILEAVINSQTPAAHLAKQYFPEHYGTARLVMSRLRKESQAPKVTYRQTLVAAQLNPPVEHPEEDRRLGELERQIHLLREQLTWAQRAASEQRTGGTATIVKSDDHFGDRSHMGHSYKQMEDKSLIVLKQYRPKKICIVHNGDAVAGRGIYRNQNMDAVLQSGEEQIKVAAIAIQRYDKRLKEEFPEATVTHRLTRGNHDMAMGEPLAPQLTLMLRALGVSAVYCGDSTIVNLADNGFHYLYAEHGYGFSGISPSSPKWLADMKDKLLSLVRRGYHGEKFIRRITHGHTHWMQLGMERHAGFMYDCTGGCQRNERVLLGKNSRPMGWIAYISPEGFESILDPIGIQPDQDTIDKELADPYLLNKNLLACGEALEAYDKLVQQLGIVEQIEPEGR